MITRRDIIKGITAIGTGLGMVKAKETPKPQPKLVKDIQFFDASLVKEGPQFFDGGMEDVYVEFAGRQTGKSTRLVDAAWNWATATGKPCLIVTHVAVFPALKRRLEENRMHRPANVPKGNIVFLPVDPASQEKVRSAAAHFRFIIGEEFEHFRRIKYGWGEVPRVFVDDWAWLFRNGFTPGIRMPSNSYHTATMPYLLQRPDKGEIRRGRIQPALIELSDEWFLVKYAILAMKSATGLHWYRNTAMLNDEWFINTHSRKQLAAEAGYVFKKHNTPTFDTPMLQGMSTPIVIHNQAAFLRPHHFGPRSHISTRSPVDVLTYPHLVSDTPIQIS